MLPQKNCLAAAALLFSCAACARAQTPAPIPAGALLAPAPSISATRFAGEPARDVAAQLSKTSGVLVVVDRTVALAPVTLTTPPVARLDVVLAKIAAILPKGTVVKKTFLPLPAPGAPAPAGDAVAALVTAQEALMTPPPPPAGGGEIDLLGKRFGPDQAPGVAAALNLRPVYLLTNPNVANDPVGRMNAAQADLLKNWFNMTDDQKQAMMDQQFEAFLSMDPQLRRSMMEQQMKYGTAFMQKLQNLPPQQKAQFWRDVTGGKWDGTGAPPPGTFPGQGGGNSNNNSGGGGQ